MRKFILVCASALVLIACGQKSEPIIIEEPGYSQAIDQAFLDICLPLSPIQEAHKTILSRGWTVDEPLSHPGIAHHIADRRGIISGQHPNTLYRVYSLEIDGSAVYLEYATVYHASETYGGDADTVRTLCAIYDFEPVDYGSVDEAVAFISKTIGQPNEGAYDYKPKWYAQLWKEMDNYPESQVVTYRTNKYNQGDEDMNPGTLKAFEQTHRMSSAYVEITPE